MSDIIFPLKWRNPMNRRDVLHQTAGHFLNPWRKSMKTKTFVLLVQLLLLVTVSASAQKKAQTNEAVAPLIPMKDFFRNPVKVGYSLSPNGEYLAYLQPWE